MSRIGRGESLVLISLQKLNTIGEVHLIDGGLVTGLF